MIQRPLAPSSSSEAKRSGWFVLLPLVAVLFASGLLAGCVVEEPGHHGGWGWHHHDD